MDAAVYTIHHKGAADVRAIADRFNYFAMVVPPLWAVWNGLWLTLLAQAVLIGLAGLWSPLAMPPVFYGLAAAVAWEGGAIARAELWLRGWREVGVVEARTPEGAEELYIRGEVS